MPIITIVILIHSRQDTAKQSKARQDKTRHGKAREDKTRQDKTGRNIHRFVAYNDNEKDNDNDNDNHYSMNSDGMKIIS